MEKIQQTKEDVETAGENTPPAGKLKIFFGYAAGVGKTYAMLEAAHQAQKEGMDVVVGYVEPHARPDTLALLDGLEILPCQEIDYRGIQLKEFDLDRALERKPQLILVDELAHNNAQGCRHTKRYQDVEELLQAGINVYTTVNVQHLESLNDLVSSITGIAVNERIPDHVFDRANQVELVDIEPDELVKRLQMGKVYRERQAKQALQNFFTTEKLAALREIAMRRTADQLNRTALQKGKEKSAKAGEHILICLSSAPSNAKVIRTAARMAEAFHSGFTALFVQTPETKELSGENLNRLRKNLRLAEQLGRSREAKSIPRNDAQMETFRTMVREPATVPEQVDGLQQSDDILRLLPPELATLGITELEYEFYRRLVEKQLLTYRLHGESWREKVIERPVVHKDYDEQPRGPFIVCVDTSGSMGGFNEQCAKAFCLALMRIALAENRRCYIMLFSTESVRYELSGPQGIEQAIRFLSQQFRGGTDLASCFRAIMERLQSREWFDADAVVISDFIAQRLPDDVTSKVKELQRVHQHRFHAVAMSAHGKPGIMRIFDHIWRFDTGMRSRLLRRWRR